MGRERKSGGAASGLATIGSDRCRSFFLDCDLFEPEPGMSVESTVLTLLLLLVVQQSVQVSQQQ